MEERGIKWFEGSVLYAIKQMKKTNSLLLVFVIDDPQLDEFSNKFNLLYADGIPCQPVSSIAIRIEKNSLEFEQFKKIYVSVPIPSAFIIGKDGRPLTILCCVSPEEMVMGLKREIECLKPSYNPYDEPKYVKGPLEKARIQFRLPSEKTRSWDFPSKATLRDVKLFLMDNVYSGPRFKLVSVYPRKTFTSEDECETLEDLSLTPTATLIVVPEQGIQANLKKMIARNSLIYTIFSALFKPVLSIFAYIQGFLGTPMKRNFEQSKIGRKGPTPVKRFCKRSSTANNVHSFAFDESESDSDMNTDNGNSTQQM